jgi:DNA ligase-4
MICSFLQVFSAPYSLRFPRIDRVRYDKPWHECLDVQCKWINMLWGFCRFSSHYYIFVSVSFFILLFYLLTEVDIICVIKNYCLIAAFVELVHSSNGTTQRGTDYGGLQESRPKRMKFSKGERKKVSVGPSHLIQTDISDIKGGSSIFSNMMFCILLRVLQSYHFLTTSQVIDEASDLSNCLLFSALNTL